MVTPYANPRSHDHRFIVPPQDDAVTYEYGVVSVREACERRGCDWTYVHRWEITKVRVEEHMGFTTLSGGSHALAELYDDNYELAEEIDQALAQKVSDGTPLGFAEWDSATESDVDVDVDVDGTTYRIHFEYQGSV